MLSPLLSGEHAFTFVKFSNAVSVVAPGEKQREGAVTSYARGERRVFYRPGEIAEGKRGNGGSKREREFSHCFREGHLTKVTCSREWGVVTELARTHTQRRPANLDWN